MSEPTGEERQPRKIPSEDIRILKQICKEDYPVDYQSELRKSEESIFREIHAHGKIEGYRKW